MSIYSIISCQIPKEQNLMRSLLSWVVAHRLLVVLYLSFGISSRVKQSKKKSLILEFGKNRLSQNVGKQLIT